MTTDYGDIILALKDQSYTKSISISTDHGHTFKTVPMTEEKFMILHSKRLVSNPQVLLLSTARATNKAKYALVLSLDLSKLISQKCIEDNMNI